MESNCEDRALAPTFPDPARIEQVDYRDPQLMPLVSVVVPIFDAASTLEEALCSIEVQTMEDIEIVCVDDASTDESPAIIAQHAAEDARYTIVTHACNCGYGAAMNDGIAAARGRWIAILEPDDLILHDMYERLLTAPATFGVELSQVDIIKSSYIREVREDGVERGGAPKYHLNSRYHGRVNPASQPFTMQDAQAAHLLRHHPSIWSALYQRDFLTRNHIAFHEYPGSGWADNEFFYDTLLRAQAIVYLDEAFYVYREETAEEFAEVARERKSLRFERWQGMADILDALGIEEEPANAAHVSKGFSYASEALAVWGDEDAEVNSALDAMFARMDPSIVAAEARISPALKARYFASRGISYDPRKDKLRYYRALASEFFHTMKSNGVVYAFEEVKKVLRG